MRGFAYLADFGIASTLGGGSTLSRPGLAVGTAAYMAPERMSGDRVDERADVYSLACMFFECLTGRRPFPASDLLQALRAHLAAPRPLPSEHGADVPPALDDVVTRGMAKDPDDRYATAGDLAEAAREALAAPDVVAEPPTEVDGLTEAGLPAVEPAADVVPDQGPDDIGHRHPPDRQRTRGGAVGQARSGAAAPVAREVVRVAPRQGDPPRRRPPPMWARRPCTRPRAASAAPKRRGRPPR